MPDLPEIPSVEGFTARAAVESDSADIVALQDACFEVDRTYREAESEILDRFDDPGIDAATDSLLVFAPDGSLVVSVWSILPAATTWWRAFGEVHVHPRYRTDRWMSFAQDWWEARSRQRLQAIDDDLEKVLWLMAYEHEVDRIAFLGSRGYQVTRYFDELIRDLAQPIEPRALPRGVTAVAAEEAEEGDELFVHNEAFRDHWGSQPFSPERWDRFKNEFYLPGASWVAYDGEEPVGHVMSGTWPHDYEDRGFRHAWIWSVGVVRSHRKRGIASALVTMALEDFVANDMAHALLDVDSDNPTGAYGLYEALGFVRDRRTLALLKPI
jgi:ribosomal protein S18 acetylase RimI-like enzyme